MHDKEIRNMRRSSYILFAIAGLMMCAAYLTWSDFPPGTIILGLFALGVARVGTYLFNG